MHDTGPVSPTNEPDAGSIGASEPTSATPADAPAKAQQAAPKRRKPSADPVVRWLIIGLAGVVVLWLVFMLSAMIFGLLSTPVSPRTSAERDLMVLTGTVQSGKATTQTYSQYVATLISAGQLAKAEQALDQALSIVKKDKSYLYAQQAQLALAQKDYEATVQAADKAMAEAKKELQAFMDENVKNNRKRTAGAQMPASFTTAALAKAQALVISKDWPGAVKAFDVYLKESPTDADVMVQRALAKIETGDEAGAEKDFKAALKYIPDYEPALDGLKQIGAEK